MTRQWGNPEVSDEAFWDAQLFRLLTSSTLRILMDSMPFTISAQFNSEYDRSFGDQQDCARTAIKAAMEISPLLPQ